MLQAFLASDNSAKKYLLYSIENALLRFTHGMHFGGTEVHLVISGPKKAKGKGPIYGIRFVMLKILSTPLNTHCLQLVPSCS